MEEFLRFESPNQLGNRLTTPVEIEGVAIPAGTYLTIGIGAANRDPAEFPDPDRLDIAREPNRHLAFGSGPHVCIGLNVARLEGRIAIGRFLARFPEYPPAGEPVRGGRARFRGFLAIPVALIVGCNKRKRIAPIYPIHERRNAAIALSRLTHYAITRAPGAPR